MLGAFPFHGFDVAPFAAISLGRVRLYAAGDSGFLEGMDSQMGQCSSCQGMGRARGSDGCVPSFLTVTTEVWRCNIQMLCSGTTCQEELCWEGGGISACVIFAVAALLSICCAVLRP